MIRPGRFTPKIQLLFLSTSADANIRHAFVNQGCVIEGDIQNSVLFTGAKVRKGAKIIEQRPDAWC